MGRWDHSGRGQGVRPAAVVTARTFFRAHGLGNDYLVWEGDPSVVDAAWVRRVCDRHTGVGADGVLVPVGGDGAEPPEFRRFFPSPAQREKVPVYSWADEGCSTSPGGTGRAALTCETAVRIWNPDGSEAEKSGNGVRIYALWWSRRTGARSFTVGTLGGAVKVEVGEGDIVRAEMGIAQMGAAQELCGLTVWPVDVGNPHRVALVVPDDWRAVGARIEASVSGRTNVQFATVVNRERVEARIWERGAGETMASGSSASAVARVVTALGLCDGKLVVGMAGGDLAVEVGGAGEVAIVGRIVGIGRVELEGGW